MSRGLQILLAGGVLLFIVATLYSLLSPLRVTPEEARRLIKAGAKVVDVRTDLERSTLGHYPEDVHIPAAALKLSAGAQLSKSDHIVLYCNTGQRARKAAETLQELGYPKVHYIAGSYTSLVEK